MKNKNNPPHILDFELTQGNSNDFKLLKDVYLKNGEPVLWKRSPNLSLLQKKLSIKIARRNDAKISLIGSVVSLIIGFRFLLVGAGLLAWLCGMIFLCVSIVSFIRGIFRLTSKQHIIPIQYYLTPDKFGIAFKDAPTFIHLLPLSNIEEIRPEFHENDNGILYVKFKNLTEKQQEKFRLRRNKELVMALDEQVRPVYDLMGTLLER